MIAQRAHLATCTFTLHDGESGINVLCRRREHSDGGGPTPKKGIEHRERTKRASRLERSPCQMARAVQTSYVDGESRQSGGGPTPKKGIEHRERTKGASRLERSPCTMARAAAQTSYVDGESTQRRRSDAKEGHRVP